MSEGRSAEPTAGIIDSQALRAAAMVPAASRGYDGSKKVPGRKRDVITDCLGLLLVVAVTAANRRVIWTDSPYAAIEPWTAVPLCLPAYIAVSAARISSDRFRVPMASGAAAPMDTATSTRRRRWRRVRAVRR
jgi:hypothetical protein